MPATAGPAPWSTNYWSPLTQTKAGKSYSVRQGGAFEWDLSEGWHYRRASGWKTKGQKNGTVKKIQLTLTNGEKITAYKTQGYDDYVGFKPQGIDENTDLREFIEAAFSETEDKHLKFAKGAGHIKYLEYNTVFQALRVAFEHQGGICVFFRVPWAVAGHLLFLAKDGSVAYTDKHGIQRHNLGVEFWNLIRIRGQQHNARYPFEYIKPNSTSASKLSSEERKYEVGQAALDRLALSENNKQLFSKKNMTSLEQLADNASNDDNELINDVYRNDLGNDVYNPETLYLNSLPPDEDETQSNNMLQRVSRHDVYERALGAEDAYRLEQYEDIIYNAGANVRGNLYPEQTKEFRNAIADELAHSMPSEAGSAILNNYLGMYDRYGSKYDETKVNTADNDVGYKRALLQNYLAPETEADKNVATDLLRSRWSYNTIDKEGNHIRHVPTDADIQSRAEGIFAKASFKYAEDVNNGQVEASDEVKDWAQSVRDSVDKRSNYKGRITRTTAGGNNVYIDPASAKKVLNDVEFADYQRLKTRLGKYVNRDRPYRNEYFNESSKPWTIQRLKEFANSSLPDTGNKYTSSRVDRGHAEIYKRLLANGDYEGALKFLQSHRGEGKKRNYAADGDRLEL